MDAVVSPLLGALGQGLTGHPAWPGNVAAFPMSTTQRWMLGSGIGSLDAL